ADLSQQAVNRSQQVVDVRGNVGNLITPDHCHAGFVLTSSDSMCHLLQSTKRSNHRNGNQQASYQNKKQSKQGSKQSDDLLMMESLHLRSALRRCKLSIISKSSLCLEPCLLCFLF